MYYRSFCILLALFALAALQPHSVAAQAGAPGGTVAVTPHGDPDIPRPFHVSHADTAEPT